jgi:GntR family transcriptional regulator/MocR family aminotransferase
MVQLDRGGAEPLHHQLYRQIRDELASGNFHRGSTRLPSSRSLANNLGISRLTVNLAFAKLHSEGYLESRIGSGTFVADPLPETFLRAAKPAAADEVGRPPRISERARDIPDQRKGRQLDVGIAGGPEISLIPGIPAVDEVPIDIWERLRADVLAKKGAHLLRYASSHGDADLRKAIAAYLCDSRGARCHPDQIVVVAAMQQAMLVAAMTLVNPGETAWLEDPGFHQARRTFLFAGARLVPRPIDAEGLVIARTPTQPDPKLIFVTPSHQFPLGVTMSLKRRRDLIAFAQARDAFILEDDYNSEFRFNGPPLPCLQGLDHAGRVIYAGTMSKILFPSLRLGYLLVPEPLIDSVIKVRAVIDQHSSAIDQATLARFMSEGFFLSHIKRMRKLYADRRLFFIEEFHRHLGDWFDLQIAEAGLHFVAWLRRASDFARIRSLAAELGIGTNPLSYYCIEAKLPPGLIFGFAAWPRAQIQEAMAKLARALRQGKGE